MPEMRYEMARYNLSYIEAQIRAAVRAKLTHKEIMRLLGLLPRQYAQLRYSAFKKVRIAHKEWEKDGESKKVQVRNLGQECAPRHRDYRQIVGGGRIDDGATPPNDTKD